MEYWQLNYQIELRNYYSINYESSMKYDLSLNKYFFVPSTLLHIYVRFDIKYKYFIRSFMLNYIKASSIELYLFMLKFWKLATCDEQAKNS